VQWVIDYYLGQVNIQTAEGKKKLAMNAMKVISHLDDAVEAEHYIKQVARLVDVDPLLLRRQLTPGEPAVPAKLGRVEKTVAVSRRNEQRLLEQLLAAAWKQKSLRTILKNLPNEYLTEVLAKVKFYLLDSKSVELDSALADKLAELELIASQITEDEREVILLNLRELELIWAEKRRSGLLADFAAAEDGDVRRREILNGAIKGLNKQILTLRRTGLSDDFAGLFVIWVERKEE
jgi:DNA primase